MTLLDVFHERYEAYGGDAFVLHLARSFIPMWILMALYILFMPHSGSPPFGSLQLHQQVIALTAWPSMIWSLWRFNSGIDEARE